MPLTNYLAQLVVDGLVFLGVRLGLIGQRSLPATYLYALALYAVQCLGSRRWLAWHTQSPVEWLWRRLT